MWTLILSFAVILLALSGLGLGALVQGRSLKSRCAGGAACVDAGACGVACTRRQDGSAR